MKGCIKLKGVKDSTVWVNPLQILKMNQDGHGSYVGTFTWINLPDKHVEIVKETPEEINRLVRELNAVDQIREATGKDFTIVSREGVKLAVDALAQAVAHEGIGNTALAQTYRKALTALIGESS